MTAAVGQVTPGGAGSWKWQLRDKNGRWIQMGSEVSFSFQGKTVTGVIVGSTGPGKATVRLADGTTVTVPTSGVTATGKMSASGPGGTIRIPEQPGQPRPGARRRPIKARIPEVSAPERGGKRKRREPTPQQKRRARERERARRRKRGGGTDDEMAAPTDRRLNGIHRQSKSIESVIRDAAKQKGKGDPFADEKTDRDRPTKGGPKDGDSKPGDTKDRSEKGRSEKPRKDTRKKLTQSQIDAVAVIMKAVLKHVRAGEFSTALGRLDDAEALLKDTSAPWLNKRIAYLQKGLKGLQGITASAVIVEYAEALLARGSAPSWTWQLRDRLGQWVEMHSEVRWLDRGKMRTGHVVGSPSDRQAVVLEDVTGRKHTISTIRLTSSTSQVAGPEWRAGQPDPPLVHPSRPTISSTDYMALRTLRQRAITGFGGDSPRVHGYEFSMARNNALQALDAAATKGITVTEALKKLTEARRQMAAARAWSDIETRRERLQMLEAQITMLIRRLTPPEAVKPPKSVRPRRTSPWATKHDLKPPHAHPVTAAGDSWRWQLRDRQGQWLDMGSRVSWLAGGLLHTGRLIGSPKVGTARVRDDKTGKEFNFPSKTRLTALPTVGSKVRYTTGGKYPKAVLAEVVGEPKPGRYEIRTLVKGQQKTVAAKALTVLPLDQLRTDVREHGGSSVRIGGETPTTGYMVAQTRGGVSMPDSEFFGPNGADRLMEFMRANADQFDSDPDVYLGLWHDTTNGQVTIDVSHNVQDRDTAVLMGQYQDQVSIWDVVNAEEIDTGGTGGYAPAREVEGVHPPGQEGLGDDGRGTPDVGRGADQSRPPRIPPPTGDTRPVAVATSMAALDPVDYSVINNGGGTLRDPVHVYAYDATETTPARTLTVRQSDVAAHVHAVVEAARHGRAYHPKADPVKVATAPDWYPIAHARAIEMQQRLNKEYGADVTLAQVAGVIAAMSPRQAWEQNLVSAEKVISAQLQHPDMPLEDLKTRTNAGLEDNVLIGLRILRGEDPSVMTGTKRRSFWNNVLDPGNDYDVTIDGWMASAIWRMGGTYSDGTPVDEKALAWLDKGKTRGGKEVVEGAGYIIMADAIRDVAAQLKMRPHEVQAVYWTSVGGGELGTQMWSMAPRITDYGPGYNRDGQPTWKAMAPNEFRYGRFTVLKRKMPKGTAWLVNDPASTDPAHPFMTKKEATEWMASQPGEELPTELPYEPPLPVPTVGGDVALAASGEFNDIMIELDADGGEWCPPDDYDAVAIHDMADIFRSTDGPVDGLLSAWEITGPHPTAGQIQWCWENPTAWELLNADPDMDVDREWFIEQVVTRTPAMTAR